MTTQDFFALSPLLLLTGSSVLVMLLIALRCSHRVIQLFSLLFFIVTFLSLFSLNHSAHFIKPLIVVDGFSIFIMALILFSSIVVNILSYIYFDEKEESAKEYYVLLFLATLGSCTLAVSNHFISLFLGLEILSVALYGLIAYLRARLHPIEASIKYLVLAAFSSAFLLFGMALIYLETGSMEFSGMEGKHYSTLFITGLGMMLVGIGFKLAIVPFHLWAADVYQGAPAPITAFIATASKGGVFAVLYRYFDTIDGLKNYQVLTIIICIAISSMVVGNILALQQQNVKRVLAYSSIAHLGYLLVAFVAGGTFGTSAITFYLLAYFLSSLTAFGVVTLLSGYDSDADAIEDYRGLFWRRPLLAVIFSVSLISLAGIPLTIGFIGKFYILTAGINMGFWISSVVLVLSSVIGLYYYLRIITAMYSDNKDAIIEAKKSHPAFYLLSSVTLSIITILILWLGINPSAVLGLMSSLLGK